MTEGSKSAGNRNTIIYSVHSHKGGVGKTSIAIAIAGLEAITNNKKVLIIDADLTGTSIKDVLEWKGKKTEENYVNELILGAPEQFRKLTHIAPIRKNKHGKRIGGMDSFYYQSKIDENIYFIPSSRDYDEISKIIPLISQEDYLHYLRHRFEDILAAAITDEFDVIIIDLPPGFYGLSKTICNIIFGQVENKENEDFTRLEGLVRSTNVNSNKVIKGRAVFISTSDPVDYKALFPIFCQYKKKEKNKLPYSKLKGCVYFIFNKVAPLEEGEETDPPLIIADILKEMREDRDKKINMEALVNFIENHQEKLGAVTCNRVNYFNMAKILSTILSIQEKTQDEQNKASSPSLTGGVSLWCKAVGKTMAILK